MDDSGERVTTVGFGCGVDSETNEKKGGTEAAEVASATCGVLEGRTADVTTSPTLREVEVEKGTPAPSTYTATSATTSVMYTISVMRSRLCSELVQPLTYFTVVDDLPTGRPLAEPTRRPAAARALAKTIDFMLGMRQILPTMCNAQTMLVLFE